MRNLVVEKGALPALKARRLGGRVAAGLMAALLMLLLFAAAVCAEAAPDYALEENWAYWADGEDRAADVFFLCPTVFFGDDQHFNMAMDDEETKANFLGATNMEKGIYDAYGTFYAPYYRQVGLNVYEMPEQEREACFAIAYEDVKAAFTYYLEHCNDGRPVILAGFSQGADMSLRLLKDCFADEAVNDLLVACYAIGWRITQEEMDAI